MRDRGRTAAAVCLGVAAILASATRGAAQSKGTWAFNPPKDTFGGDALLDLRSLNEPTAGQSGFVRLSPDGNDMLLADGRPARFWAVTDYTQRVKDPAVLPHHARWLAKHGVNMVRFHGALQPKAADSKVTDVDEAEVDQCWKLVAAMKKEGIYTTVSPYWAIPVDVRAGWNVPDGERHGATALLFFDKTMQEGYKAWARALFARPNKYTGIPLAQDPAVALIQIQNEDSMLFWTMGTVIKDKHSQTSRELFKLFGDWLKQKYGSLDKAKAAWDGTSLEADDLGAGLADLYTNWEWTQPQAGGKQQRLADQLEFYGRTMYQFNAEMARFYRDELGCKQLINAGNWRTADQLRLHDVERWSYTANDVIAVNRYFGGIHIGKHAGWAVEPGDQFTNDSALTDPDAFPLTLKQVAGHPMVISESLWVPPNLYQSEGPFLVAAYQSLTGIDAFYWFCDGDVGEWQPPIHKWNVATPELLGQFPAAALMYRMGYIRKGDPVVHEERALDDLWQRKFPVIAEEKGFDPNRDQGTFAERSGVKTAVDPLAYWVGPVEVKYDGDPAKTTAVNLAQYVDRAKKTVRSVTGELALNYDKGVCTLDAPKAQGVTGFLEAAGGNFKLADVTIRSADEYATVTVVSADDQPLAASRKILVQVGTTARPTGWEDRPAKIHPAEHDPAVRDGFVVQSSGKPPWQIADSTVLLTVRNPGLKTATALDANLEAVGEVEAKLDGGAMQLRVPAGAMYVMLR